MADAVEQRQSYPRPTIVGDISGLPNAVPIASRITAEGYRREHEAVFRRSWLLIGHVEKVQEPGSYFVVDVPTFGASLIVTRDKAGVLHGFHNVCRHRGNRLVQTRCGAAEGRAARFTCGFHGWTFANDGRLIGVPEEAMFLGLDRARHGLVPVPVEDWGGLIFAYFGGEPEMSLKAWLGELYDGFDGYFAGMVQIGAVQADLACNWNIALDAFSEGYHTAFLHRNTVLNFFPPPDGASAAPIGIMPTVELFERHQRVVTGAVDQATTLVTEHLLARRGRRIAPFAETDFSHLPPGVNPGRVSPWAFDDIKLFPNTAILAQPHWSATLTMWPDGAERTRFRLNIYAKPARGAGDLLNQAYWRTLVYHTTLEDLSTVEATDRALRSGAVPVMPLSLHELPLQRRYQVAGEMMDAAP